MREQVRKLARYSLDNPWRGVLPVPFNEREQETVYAAMMAAMDETIDSGGSIPAMARDKKGSAAWSEWAGQIATFLIDHHPDTPGPDDERESKL